MRPFLSLLLVFLLTTTANAQKKKNSEIVAEFLQGLAAALDTNKTDTASAGNQPKPLKLPALQPGEWAPHVDFDSQLFPSFHLACATMEIPKKITLPPNYVGNEMSTFGILIANPAENTVVKVQIKENSLMEAAEFETTLSEAGKTYVVYPPVNFNFDALLKVTQTKPLNVTFLVSTNGINAGQKTKTVQVRSINDCLYAAFDERQQGPESAQNFSFLFAAYVNENHPWIDTVLQSALQSRQIESFSGYQRGTAAAVHNQVYAIWNVLQQKGFRYSSITRPSGVSKTVYSQHVRFLDECITATQANCVDGTVLFASILRKIQIDPVLVLVPGHCFLGYYLDEDKKQLAFLETTMLGDVDFARLPDDDSFAALFSPETKNQASWKSFWAATQEGENKFKAGITKSANDPRYQLVDISKVRELRILPIAYNK